MYRLVCQKTDNEIVLELTRKTIDSFHKESNKGLPLDNLTSQLFANVYLNPFDHFVKRKLHAKFYLRYADDIIILSKDKNELVFYLKEIKLFLENYLHIQIHPNKVSIRTWRQGIDVLGYVSYPTHRTIRTKTKKRIKKKIAQAKILLEKGLISKESYMQTIASYKGRIKHCWSQGLQKELGL